VKLTTLLGTAAMELVVLLALAAPQPVRAGDPEYMKIQPRVGMGLEIKGALNPKGIFVATDLEVIKEIGHPRLRGALQALDAKAGTITVHGARIHIDPLTRYDGQANPNGLATLQPSQRIEVNCTVDSVTGRWSARKIVTVGVKPSDKIKGTISRCAVDGVPPDTLEIAGFRILLDELTDVVPPLGVLRPDRIERTLFGDLSYADATQVPHGRSLARGVVWGEGQVRQGLRDESDFDLSTAFRSDQDDFEPELRLEAAAFNGSRLRMLTQARVRKRITLGSDTRRPSSNIRLELTQLYGLWKNIGGRRLAVAIGRQDVDDPREWLFDEYLEAARFFAYGRSRFVVEAAVFLPVLSLKEKNKTWTDVYATAHWIVRRRGFLSGYVLARSDSDVRNRQPVWTGLRFNGALGERWRPWLELASMFGEDRGQTLRAYAVDLGATLQSKQRRFYPYITAGYAWGSGDSNRGDGVDRTFRQTGYQDNYGRFAGVSRIRYYGSLLDPELSNLAIWTLGLGAMPSRDSSVDLVGHVYRQDALDDRLRTSELINPPARPNGASDDLGWGVDLIVTTPQVRNTMRATWTLALFRPGTAFHPRRDMAWLYKAGLTAVF